MPFIKDKTDLFGEISATKALSENFPELNKAFNSFNSVKSKSGDLTPFFLDLIRELIGAQIQTQFREFLKKTDKFENKIKKIIADEVIKKYKNSNFKLSDIENPVLSTNIKNIDIDGTLKMDPESDLGKFYYGKAAPAAPALPNDPAVQVGLEPGGDFQKFLFDVKQNGEGNWKNIFKVKWPAGEDKLTIDIDQNYLAEKTIENLVLDFLNSVKIFDFSKIMADILDLLFGAISSLTDAGVDWLEDKLKLKQLCDKVINKESLADDRNPPIYDNSFFEFSQKEKDQIRNISRDISTGNNLVNLGCSTAETGVDLNDLEEAFDSIQNVKPSLVKESFTGSLEKIMEKSTAGVNEENRENVLANLFGQVWEYIVTLFMSQTIKPFNVILQQIGESLLSTLGVPSDPNFEPPGIEIDNTSLEKSSVEDYFIKFRSLNTCLIKEIYSLLIEFLFDVVKAEIIKLVAVKVAQIQADQQRQYKEQIESAKEVLKNVNNLLSLINNITGG